MNYKKIINMAGDVTAGALISTFLTSLYLIKEKYIPKDKKKRKKLKKQIEKHGLELEISPVGTALTISTLFVLYEDIKKGDKYTIFSSAIFTTILLNLLIFKKK